MAWVYILQNETSNFYIGSTTNIKPRLAHHKSGYTPSTKRYKEIKLVFLQEFPSLKTARKIETRLKNYKRKDFIEKIINDKIIRKGV